MLHVGLVSLVRQDEHEHQCSMYDAEDVGMTSALLSA